MRLYTEDEEMAYDSGQMDGAEQERKRIIELMERNICFDALADPDGRCSHHGGKCYDLRQLIVKLQGGNR